MWLVGARDECEGELARRGWLAEVLAALCPAAPCFEFVLIGPEMKGDWELGAVRSIRGTLHERDVAGRPDVAVLINSGIGTLLEPLVTCWLPTLAQLLALDVPLCFTCYHDRFFFLFFTVSASTHSSSPASTSCVSGSFFTVSTSTKSSSPASTSCASGSIFGIEEKMPCAV